MPTRRLRVGTWVAVVAAAAAAGPGRAADPLPVKLDGLLPAGRPSTTDRADSVLWFSLENPNPEPRAIRVLVFYNGRPDVQYGRDVWVPGRAKVKSWVTIGPPPRAESIAAREIKYILSDRTDGPARVLTPPPERMPGRGIPYMTREPSTAVLLDQLVTDAPPLEAGTPAWRAFLEVVELIQTFRASRGQTEFVFAPPDRFLPPTAAALDGLDQVVLAGDRLAADPVGARAVREWVLGGGTLWVMLDRVDPGTVALVLGEDPGFEVAGRTTLTEALLVRAGDDPRRAKPVPHDDPVEFVRVLPTGPLTVLIEQDGWPAAFTRPFGRGKVVVTTAGARAWHRPRVLPVGFRGGNRPQPGGPPQPGRPGPPGGPGPGPAGPRPTPQNPPPDPPSPYINYPALPVASYALELLALELYPEGDPGGVRPDDLAPLVASEIGYEVIGPGTGAAVLGGCVLAAAGLAAGLRRGRRPELAGLAAPAAAVGAAALLVGLGAASRRAVPPTAVSAAVVDFAPGAGEGAAVGLFAVYRPESGDARLGSDRGGFLDLDTTGVERQTRRRVQTDLGAWHWEDFALPAGVRAGPFRATVPAGDLRATARFGPAGLDGRLVPGPFADPADAVVRTAAGEPVGVRLAADGSFAANDPLAPGQYLTGGVLSDGQQRRQEVYRRLLGRPTPRHLDGRDLFLVWARTDDLPFYAEEGCRTVGQSLLVVPLAIERTPPDTPVAIPREYVPARAEGQRRPFQPPVDGSQPQEFKLRFTLPPAVLPMTAERAVLTLRVRAPSRPVTVTGYAGARAVPLRTVTEPTGPVRVEITDPALLAVGPDGGLTVGVEIGEPVGPAAAGGPAGGLAVDDQWRIEAVGLEVSGRTAK